MRTLSLSDLVVWKPFGADGKIPPAQWRTNRPRERPVCLTGDLEVIAGGAGPPGQEPPNPVCRYLVVDGFRLILKWNHFDSGSCSRDGGSLPPEAPYSDELSQCWIDETKPFGMPSISILDLGRWSMYIWEAVNRRPRMDIDQSNFGPLVISIHLSVCQLLPGSLQLSFACTVDRTALG